MERDLKCMYCAEMGITNTDIFIEIVDVELGVGWICKECFVESEKEKDEHLKELEAQLKAKEQECEELKEARKNSRCAWKSLEGTFCPEAQEQLNAYKMEAEEGKEINAELKAENEELRDKLTAYIKEAEENFEVHTTLKDNYKKLSQTLTEIKEIAEDESYIGFWDEQISEILQKISECEANQ